MEQFGTVSARSAGRDRPVLADRETSSTLNCYGGVPASVCRYFIWYDVAVDLGADMPAPGLITLMGSGETSPGGRILHEAALGKLSRPVNVVIMETPAGFEPNSAYVANRVSEFIRRRLRNHGPVVTVIPARRRDSEMGTNNPDILRPILNADYIFMGPGSPSYAVRHLAGSLAWEMILARHRLGACLGFSSSAVISVGKSAVPIYEIYKVGEDPRWIPGLDLLGHFGLRLACVTHWNNTEGGANLDTSRCYVGRDRMEVLLSTLSSGVTVVGIDEHTALTLDFSENSCRVVGKGTVTLIRDGEERVLGPDRAFPMSDLGEIRIPEPDEGIRPDVWAEAAAAQWTEEPALPDEAAALVAEREGARQLKDWDRADMLRARLSEMGYAVVDTPDGPRLDVA